MGGREGLRSKNLAGKEPSRLSPPGEPHCLQNKQRNEKDKGGLRSGRRHEMTHKHAGAAPHRPSSLHSHLQHLLANLHLLIYGWVLEELHAEVALPQGRVALHAVTRAAHKQHLHTVLASSGGKRQKMKKHKTS